MTGAGIFAGQMVGQGGDVADASKTKNSDVVQVSTDITGAPIIAEGKVLGYLVFRVKSSVDVSKLPNAKFEVSPFLVDAAFHSAYVLYQSGFTSIGPNDLDKLTQQVAERVNQKLGAGIVTDVEIDQFNYIPADRVRQNIFAPK